MTQIDAAHEAMEAAPEDDAVRLRFWGSVAESELFLMLAEESVDGQVTPAEVEVEGQRFVLAFDREERLATFAGGVVPYAALSGRRLAGMLAGQGLGIALNPDVAPSAILMGPEAVDWLSNMIADGPAAAEQRIEEVFAPKGLPEEVIAALDRRLAAAGGMAQAAWLVLARYEGGGRGHVLAIVGALPGAEAALAETVAEALRFSGIEAGALDVTFVAADSPVVARFARVGLRFDLPTPAMPVAPGAPGMDASRPPRLK
jgi:hypothetical protein